MNTIDSQIVRQPEPPVTLLDPRAPGGVVVHDPKPLRAWAATISAGFKAPGAVNPTIVKDGKMILHEDMGEAPGIRAALKATDHRFLTVTMMSNNIAECLSQLFACYESTKIFGDRNTLTAMKMENGVQVRKVVKSDQPGFAELLERCKVSTFVPFMLAEWTDEGPRVVFPDGFLPYRLRFSSLNSARAFVDSLEAIKRLTGGILVGVPLQLSIVYQDKMTPKLERRKVPIWNARIKHPTIQSLGARDINNILTAGIKDAAQMALPASILSLPADVIEATFLHDEAIDVDEETGEITPQGDMKTATEGSAADTRVKDFFRAVRGTVFADDDSRAALVTEMAKASGIDMPNTSLRTLAEIATQEEWNLCTEVFCRAAANWHGTEVEKPAKPVVTEENPFTAPAEAKKEAAPPEATAAVETEAKPPAEPEQAPKPEAEAKTAAPKARAKAKADPVPANYLLLERAPTDIERERAFQLTKSLLSQNLLTQEQFAHLKREAGKIDVAFVLLEAERRGISDIPGIYALFGGDAFSEPTEPAPQAPLL